MIDTGTQTINEITEISNCESIVNENDRITHYILSKIDQNDSDSINDLNLEFPINSLNVDVKKIKIEKSDKPIRKLIVNHNRKSHRILLKSNFMRKKKTKIVKHKSCRLKTKIKFDETKSLDVKKHKHDVLKNLFHPSNHEFSKFISIIPGTKMKEK
jgi:hypothetical protein